MAARTISPLDVPNYDDRNSTNFLSLLAYDGATARVKDSNYSWDVAGCCQDLLPTFHYLSNKLAFQGLHVAFVVVDGYPEVIPAWPIDKHTQQFFRKMVTRAGIKYAIDPLWVTALNNLCITTDIQETIHLYRETTYLVHRSLLQKDIIYSGNGLTVLAVDYVYKLKEQLAVLAREDILPLFRDDYKESSITLLKHINDIYKDIPLTKAYLRRAYTQFELREDVMEEVFEAYHGKYRYSIRHRPSALQSIAMDSSARDEKVAFIVDETQESPRKLPILARKQPIIGTSTIAAGRRSLERAHKPTLGSPFEYRVSFSYSQQAGIERPRSPKGDLFESSRSTSTTSPRSLKEFPEPEDLLIRSSSFPSSEDDCDMVRIETASTTSSRRRRLFAPWLNLSRSNSLSSFLKNKISARYTLFNTGRNATITSIHSPLPIHSMPKHSGLGERPPGFL